MLDRVFCVSRSLGLCNGVANTDLSQSATLVRRYQLLAQEYGYWEKYHTVVTGNVEDGRKEAINNRCSHVRINQAKTLVRALEGTLAVPPFLMLDDHAEAFAPQKVLDLVNNKTVAKQCSVYVSISPPAKLVIKT